MKGLPLHLATRLGPVMYDNPQTPIMSAINQQTGIVAYVVCLQTCPKVSEGFV